MLGVVILNYNTADDTVKCVLSIKEKTNILYKIFVVDNNSKDDSARRLKTEFENDKNVELLCSDTNGGYSKGNNIGIKVAVDYGCDKILIINPDVLLQNQALEIMADTLDSDPTIAVVGPKVINEQGELQDLIIKGLNYKQYITNKQPLRMIYNLITGKRFAKPQSGQILPDDIACIDGMVSGCCFMVRSDFFQSIGYFDDNVFLYCEEEIIYEEIKKATMKVCYNPQAVVIHKGSSSIGGWMSVFSRRCFAFSRLYFQFKYEKSMKGLKKAIAVWLTKTDFVLMSKKLKQDYKEQYKQLKADIKRLKEEMA